MRPLLPAVLLLAACSGATRAPAAPASSTQANACPPTVDTMGVIILGGLDKKLIDRVIAERLPQMGACYAGVLEDAGASEATAKVRFAINGSGQVIKTELKATTLPHARAEECLLETIAALRFPQPQSELVIALYPFAFRPCP